MATLEVRLAALESVSADNRVIEIVRTRQDGTQYSTMVRLQPGTAAPRRDILIERSYGQPGTPVMG